MASSCELSKSAYTKIILHALKYPHTEINGLLLANEGSNQSTLKIVDAIPLFHHNLGLAPMLEVALMQVDCYCRSAGLVIAGYYQANESVNDAGPDFVCQKIMDTIKSHFPSACLVMVDNQQLSKNMKQPAVHIMQYHDGKWKVKDKDSLNYLSSCGGALELTSKLVAGKLYKELVDFDDHLDDLNQNWLNLKLNEAIDGHST
nr:EOG090X0C9C [Sida crystallina]